MGLSPHGPRLGRRHPLSRHQSWHRAERSVSKGRRLSKFAELRGLASDRIPMRVLAYRVMPNRFQLALRPYSDRDLGRWVQWLLTAHVRRYHQHYRSSGRVWQGRFKVFSISQDDPSLTVLRYIYRNPLRAGLVERAEDGRWSSLQFWRATTPVNAVNPAPVANPENWLQWVH